MKLLAGNGLLQASSSQFHVLESVPTGGTFNDLLQILFSRARGSTWNQGMTMNGPLTQQCSKFSQPLTSPHPSRRVRVEYDVASALPSLEFGPHDNPHVPPYCTRHGSDCSAGSSPARFRSSGSAPCLSSSRSKTNSCAPRPAW